MPLLLLSLPLLPRAVGIITSPTGAAVRDIRTVAKRRFAGIPLVLAPVSVQGPAAAVAERGHAVDKAHIEVTVCAHGAAHRHREVGAEPRDSRAANLKLRSDRHGRADRQLERGEIGGDLRTVHVVRID